MMAEPLDFNEPKVISAALAYAARGLPVFPCNPLNKQPMTARGFKDATTDAFQVRKWWGQWPQAMIGIPTGRVSGFWVLDIDEDKERGKFGLASLAEMGHDVSELMDTAVSVTGSGGYHMLFRWSEDQPLTNSRGALKSFLDVRGEGGYIVAAGSVRGDGRRYRWLNPPDENEIAEAPEWLLAAILGAPASASDFDFNGAQRAPVAPAERVAAIAPGTWHENTRDLVARMVREGASDETVAAIAPKFTEPGYTHQETVTEFLSHARTARAKWGYQPKDLAAHYEPLPAADDGRPRFRFNLTFFDDIGEEHHKGWLIRDLFGDNELSVVYGAPGSGKSVLMGDAACHVAAGLAWFGRRTQQCAILYVAAERHKLVKRRMAAWRKHHGILNLPIVVLDGLFDFASNTAHGDEIARIAEHVSEATGHRVGWVIIDTKAQVMGGKDENSSQDVSVLNSNIARIQQTGAHVTVVDHTPQSDPTRPKGNGGLLGAADGSFLVLKEGKARTLTIGSKAPNDGPDDIEIAFSLEGVVLGINAEGEKTEAPVVVAAQRAPATTSEPAPAQPLGSLQQKIMTAVVQAARDGQKLGFNRLMAMTGSDNGNVGKALRKLCDRGLIIEVPTEEGGKFWTTP